MGGLHPTGMLSCYVSAKLTCALNAKWGWFQLKLVPHVDHFLVILLAFKGTCFVIISKWFQWLTVFGGFGE